MNLRIPIACCVMGALITGNVAITAVVFSLSSEIFSKDLSTLKLAPIVTEAQIEQLRDQPAGKLIIGLNADTQKYSSGMVEVTTILTKNLRSRLIEAIVGGGLSFLLFTYVGFALWKHKDAKKT